MGHTTELPTLAEQRITRRAGLAGQYAYTVTVAYGDRTHAVTFVGQDRGHGPVVMVTGPDRAHQTFVTDPGRFGPFGAEWVRRFYAD